MKSSLYFIVMLIVYPSLFTGLCEVENGKSNIILDIEESRGSRK